MDSEKRQKLKARLQRPGWPSCDTCGKKILYSRLETLPETTTCVKHSREAGYVGVNVYAHKTAPVVAMVKGDREESVRQLWNGYNRKR